MTSSQNPQSTQNIQTQDNLYSVLQLKKDDIQQKYYSQPIQSLKKQVYLIRKSQQLRHLQKDIQKKYQKYKNQDEKKNNQTNQTSQTYLNNENNSNDQTNQNNENKKKFTQLKQFINNYITWSEVIYDEQTSMICQKFFKLKDQRQKQKNDLNSITERLKDLSNIKSLILAKICNQNKDFKAPDNNQLSQSDKILKLTEIDQMIDDEIQQTRKKFIQPASLKSFFQDKFVDIMRQINFYLVVAWIISFLLASKDQSVCISQPIIGQKFTFRIWLWANGGITSLAALFLLITTLFKDYKNVPKKSNNQKKSQKCKGFFYLLAFIIIFIKIGWVIFGIVLFLSKLDFYMEQGYCSDDVVTYCSLQFVAFFMLVMFGFIKSIQKLAQCCAKSKNLSFYQNIKFQSIKNQQITFQSDQIAYDSSKHNILCNNGGLKQTRGYLGIAKSDFQDLCQKFFTWSLLGWIYGFVLWKKDHSPCLDMDIPFSFTYRQWLLIDASTSIAFYGYLLIIMITKTYYNSKILMLYWEKYEVYQFQIRWFMKNWITKILGFLLVIQFLFKFVWMVVGVVIFCFYLQDCENSNTLSNYLVFYFTQAMYVTFETIASIIRGCNHKLQIKYEYEYHLSSDNEKNQDKNVAKKQQSHENIDNSNKQLKNNNI